MSELSHLIPLSVFIIDAQVLYRGQRIAPKELTELKRCVGGLVSMNTFMSTSTQEDVAMSFLDLEGADTSLENVIFQYVIDVDLPFADLPPMANISRHGSIPDEEEVLLSIGTVARIESIIPDEIYGHIQHVRLRVCQPIDSSLQQFKTWLSTRVQKVNLDESNYIFQICNLLLLMGEYKRIEQLSDLFSQRSHVQPHLLQPLFTAIARVGQFSAQLTDFNSWMPNEMSKP